SPYQLLNWKSPANMNITAIQFHGDFYCIEYHKKEVACNGILFNNIYQQPFVGVNQDVYSEISDITLKMQNFVGSTQDYHISILKSYLQRILALSSKEKQQNVITPIQYQAFEKSVLKFQALLEECF